MEKHNCPCGSGWLAIDSIEGRSDDILCFKNTEGTERKIFPDFFRRAIIMSSEEIRNYVLIQKSSKLLELFVAGDQLQFKKAQDAVLKLLESQGVENVEIRQILSPKIEKGNKLRRIRNDKRATN